MAAITIQDLNNAKTDAQHLSDIANSEALTATDRLGRVKKTIAGLSAEFPVASANAAAAAASATAASISENNASASASAAAASEAAAEAARDAAIAGQSVGAIGFDTLANLSANLNFADRTIALVTSDSTASNLGYYRKSGASGTGSWVKAAASVQAGNIAAEAVTPVATSFFTQRANLFNKDTASPGFALNIANGALAANASWTASDYIPVRPSTAYIQTGGQICYYDGSLGFISGANGVTTFTTPANAAYIRFATSVSVATYQLVEGASLPSPYVAYGFEMKAKAAAYTSVVADDLSAAGGAAAVEAVNTSTLLAPQSSVIKPRHLSMLTQSTNLFNKATVTADKSLDYSGSGGLLTSSGWNTSDYIKVAPSTAYAHTGGQVCYYDINFAFISGVTGNFNFTTPANAAYVRVASAASKDTYVVSQGASLPSRYVPYGFTVSADEPVALNTPWSGKKWGVLGDSMSAADVYQNTVVAKTGLVVQANQGVAGRAFRNVDDDLTSLIIADLDLITIFAGTNDYGGNRAVGTIADAYDGSAVASFYNDVYQVLANIYTLKPTVRVAVFTPIIRGAYSTQPVYPAANGSGYFLTQYVDAIKEVCALFGTPVCDLFAESGINLKNIGTLTADNLHPTAAGYALLGRRMAAFINSL